MDKIEGPHRAMAELARQRNTHPVELMIDMALERDLKFFMIQPVANPRPVEQHTNRCPCHLAEQHQVARARGPCFIPRSRRHGSRCQSAARGRCRRRGRDFDLEPRRAGHAGHWEGQIGSGGLERHLEGLDIGPGHVLLIGEPCLDGVGSRYCRFSSDSPKCAASPPQG